jgi:hypothetical protein
MQRSIQLSIYDPIIDKAIDLTIAKHLISTGEKRLKGELVEDALRQYLAKDTIQAAKEIVERLKKEGKR